MEWCLAAPERSEQGLELASALCWFWIKRAYLREGQECVERALSANVGAPLALRAKALMVLGSLTFFRGICPSATLLEESATLGRTAGNPWLVVFSLGMSSLAALEGGDIAESARIATEGQTAARPSPSPWIKGHLSRVSRTSRCTRVTSTAPAACTRRR